MRDVMIDLETFGTGPDAVIVQIGAVYFDRNTGETGMEFKKNIGAKSACDIGGKIEASTIYWWLSQSPEAIKSIIDAPKENISEVFKELCMFLLAAKWIWCHATFDFVIIQETLKKLNYTPLNYRSARDIRTLVDLGEIDVVSMKREGIHHDALDDCKFQIHYCVEAFNKLKGF